MESENNSDCLELSVSGNYTLPGQDGWFVVAVKVTTGVTCLFSILGASLIIFTYAAFRSLRTVTRQLLVNLSVADILVALFHFLGLYTNYDRFNYGGGGAELSTRDWWCITQAAFVVLGSCASFFWTTAVALYMFVVIVLRSPVTGKRLLYVFYPVCWGVPAAIVVVFAALHLYGFPPAYGIGWCFNGVTGNRATDIVTELFGYDLWTYFTFLLLPILYVSIQCHLLKRRKCCYRGEQLATQGGIGVTSTDFKFVLVPLIFVFLRAWSFIVDLILFYLPEDQHCRFLDDVGVAVVQLIANVGNSSQGLTNGILFCLLTRAVRRKLAACLCCQSQPVRSRPAMATSATGRPSQIILEDTTELINDGSYGLVDPDTMNSVLVPSHFQWRKKTLTTVTGEYDQTDAMYRGL